MASRFTNMSITSHMGLMLIYSYGKNEKQASITLHRPAFGPGFAGNMTYTEEGKVKRIQSLSFDPMEISEGKVIASKIWAELTAFYRECQV